MKIMNNLLYQDTIRDWKKDFIQLLSNANYDPESHRITLNIPDPNLFLEIQNYIEEKGGYIEKQLNGKILQIKAEYFIQLVTSLEPEENRKKIIKELREIFKKNNKNNNTFDEKNFGKSLISTGLGLKDIVVGIGDLISINNPVGNTLFSFLKKVLNI